MGRSHRLGIHGEARAAAYLEERGWRVVDRNYRFGHREIDIVARRGGIVAFVEVKTRSAATWGHPLAAIDARKRAEILRVARVWVERHGRRGDVYRFDAIGVLPDGTGATLVEHVEDAWRA